MINGNFAPHFPLKHAQKDMKLALDLAAGLGVSLPTTQASDEVYRSVLDTHGDDGTQCIPIFRITLHDTRYTPIIHSPIIHTLITYPLNIPPYNTHSHNTHSPYSRFSKLFVTSFLITFS